MSRTLVTASPSRRSKRLIQNGYYRVQTDETNFLDMPASDEDDSASMDSDVSKVSLNDDLRSVSYKESPYHIFKNHRRRQYSHSPAPLADHTVSNVRVSSTKVRQNISFSEGQLNTIFSHKNISSLKTKSQEHLGDAPVDPAVGVVSDAALPSSNYGVERQYIAKAHSVSDQPVLRKRSQRTYRVKEQKKKLQQMEETGEGDFRLQAGDFTVLSSENASNYTHKREISRKKLQNQSNDYLSSDEDFSEKKSNYADHTVVAESAIERLFLFVLSVIHIVKSFVVELVWNAGKLFYQGVTNVLVLDMQIFCTTAKIGVSLSHKYFKIAFIFLLGCIFILLLYFGLPLLLARETKYVVQQITPTSDDSTTSTVNSGANMNDYYRSIKELKEDIKILDQKFTTRHSTIIDTVNNLIQANEQKSDEKNVKNQKRMLSSTETMVKKSIEVEMLKISDKFENKLDKIQMELHRVRTNYTLFLLRLRELQEKVENNQETNELKFLKLSDVEKHLLRIENELVRLEQDYNAFKFSINRFSGNETYLRKISSEQFIANFQALLEESTGIQADQTSDHQRHGYLARIFVMWLDQKGFAQKEALQKIRSEIGANSSRLAKFFEDSLEKSVNDLKTSYFTDVHKTSVNVVSQSQQQTATEISETLIKIWIKEALDLYSADRVGEADFALETAGGSIVNTRCSETFRHKTALVSILGIPIYYNINTPRSVIQPSVMPGECWAFEGNKGFVVINLAATVKPTAFTLDHIPKALSPNNKISSAPQNFSVYGLIDSYDVDGILLGSYRYEKDGEPTQTFFVESKAPEIDNGFRHIELRVTSNWGHPQFTCIYRFRVHGKSI